MGRRPRTICEGAVHHTIQRGNNRAYIYKEPEDKHKFLTLLGSVRDEYRFHILYYVLMDNHYHLLLKAGETPIWKAMQKLNVTYSKYYNWKYERTGGIYEGRYGALDVNGDRHFYQIIKYLAYNPVDAGLADSPEMYRWSAHNELAEQKKRLLDHDELLSYFGPTRKEALDAYASLFTNQVDDKAALDLLRIREIKGEDEALLYLLKIQECTQNDYARILRGDKTPATRRKRDAFIREAATAGFTTNSIAEFLQCSLSTVTRVRNEQTV